MVVMGVWRRRYRDRRHGVSIAVAVATMAVAAGAAAWFLYLPAEPETPPPGIMLALALSAPTMEDGVAKAGHARTVLLGLQIRRPPPQAPEAAPLLFDPPAFEPAAVTPPGVIALAPPLPGPEPSSEREIIAIEAEGPEGGTDGAPVAVVTLIELGPAVQPDAAPLATAPVGAPEPTATVEMAVAEDVPPGGAKLALPQLAIAEHEPETSPGPAAESSAPVPPPPEPAPATAPVIALIYPPPPGPGDEPAPEPDTTAPSAAQDTSPEMYEAQVALAEPVLADTRRSVQAGEALRPIEPEAPAGAELDVPETVAPEPVLASEMARWKAPEAQLESTPEVAVLAVPELDNGARGGGTPAVSLFERAPSPGFETRRFALPAPEQLEAEATVATLRPEVSLATSALTAAAPSAEIELPVKFASILPAAGRSLSAFVLSAALALEAQPDEAPASGDDTYPDDLLFDVAAALTAIRTDAKRAVDWLAFARPFDPPADKPLVAVVVLGLGTGRAATNAALKLPSAVTLGFSSYVRGLQDWIDLARAAGHEVLLDLPMEPIKYPDIDPGPQALMTSLPSAKNLERLKWHLDRATGYFGVTNNMGSRFTSSPDALKPVLSALKLRGLMYLDSRTSRSGVAEKLASEIDLPRATNDRFLDDQASRAAVDARLGEIERIALRTGFAVAVGHAFPVTIDRLIAWLPTLQDKGIVLAPVSAIVGKQAPR